MKQNNRELLIYPNPTTNVVNFEGYYDINIEMYDMVGNLILSKDNVSKIDITDYPSGIYNLKILYNGNNINHRLIKQ